MYDTIYSKISPYDHSEITYSRLTLPVLLRTNGGRISRVSLDISRVSLDISRVSLDISRVSVDISYTTFAMVSISQHIVVRSHTCVTLV